jgi:hypothetical protein
MKKIVINILVLLAIIVIATFMLLILLVCPNEYVGAAICFVILIFTILMVDWLIDDVIK